MRAKPVVTLKVYKQDADSFTKALVKHGAILQGQNLQGKLLMRVLRNALGAGVDNDFMELLKKEREELAAEAGAAAAAMEVERYSASKTDRVSLGPAVVQEIKELGEVRYGLAKPSEVMVRLLREVQARQRYEQSVHDSEANSADDLHSRNTPLPALLFSPVPQNAAPPGGAAAAADDDGLGQQHNTKRRRSTNNHDLPLDREGGTMTPRAYRGLLTFEERKARREEAAGGAEGGAADGAEGGAAGGEVARKRKRKRRDTRVPQRLRHTSTDASLHSLCNVGHLIHLVEGHGCLRCPRCKSRAYAVRASYQHTEYLKVVCSNYVYYKDTSCEWRVVLPLSRPLDPTVAEKLHRAAPDGAGAGTIGHRTPAPLFEAGVGAAVGAVLTFQTYMAYERSYAQPLLRQQALSEELFTAISNLAGRSPNARCRIYVRTRSAADTFARPADLGRGRAGLGRAPPAHPQGRQAPRRHEAWHRHDARQAPERDLCERPRRVHSVATHRRSRGFRQARGRLQVKRTRDGSYEGARPAPRASGRRRQDSARRGRQRRASGGQGDARQSRTPPPHTHTRTRTMGGLAMYF